jgi:DNA gyrase subunit A
MEVPDGESVIGLIVVPSDGSGSILTVTENGYGKRTAFENYPSQSRGGKGLIDIKTNDRNGSVADVVGVTSDDTVVLATENAQVMRTDTDGISSVGRNTQGVTVISLNDTDSPISVTKV